MESREARSWLVLLNGMAACEPLLAAPPAPIWSLEKIDEYKHWTVGFGVGSCLMVFQVSDFEDPAFVDNVQG